MKESRGTKTSWTRCIPTWDVSNGLGTSFRKYHVSPVNSFPQKSHLSSHSAFRNCPVIVEKAF